MTERFPWFGPSTKGGGSMPDRPNAFRCTRRQLLASGSAALAPVILGAGAVGAAVSVTRKLLDRPLSVGYIEGSEAVEDLRHLGQRLTLSDRGETDGLAGKEVVPASQLLIGDQALANESVALTVFGLFPEIPLPESGVAGASLAVFFPNPVPGAEDPLPFLAWRYSRRDPRAEAAGASHEIRFTAPLGLHGELRLVLEVAETSELHRRGLRSGSRRPVIAVVPRAADFTVDWFIGHPKLQRGLYLLALEDRVWDSRRSLPASSNLRAQLCSLVMAVEPLPADAA